MKNKIIEFRVKGDGSFPIDMLRRDCCWPATTDDAFKIMIGYGKREILFYGISWPTEKRWNSFGWQLCQNETKIK